MAKAISVTQVSNFDIHGDVSSLSIRWEDDWVDSFEIYAAASGVDSGVQKRALLLHCAGKEVQELFKTFGDTGTTYNAAREKLDAHFKPKKNISYQRHLFRKECQKDDETVTQFVVRLRKLAQTCAFPEDEVDNFIRDQVIDKCKSRKLREKLLSEPELTLKKVIEISQAKEASQLQAAQMAESDQAFSVSRSRGQTHAPSGSRSNAKQDSANSNSPPRKIKQCGRCGRRGHTSEECRCTRGKRCFACDGLNHFASACRSSNQNKQRSSQNKNDSARRSVRALDPDIAQSDFESSDTDEDAVQALFSLDDDASTTAVNISGTETRLLIDSGASCNVLNTADSKKLIDRGIKIHKCNRRVRPYRSDPIHVTEYITADVQFADTVVRTKFLIIPGTHVSLLGRQTAEKLKILFIVNAVNIPNPTTPTSPSSPLDRFPGIDQGIGKLKSHTVTVHVDKSIPPVARKHNRAPFHLRDKVEKELNKLQEQDIIEKVTGPTEWVSRIVTPPKPKNPSEIRVCCDMRDVNKAVLRTRHITSTIEELVSDLNGAKVFSKIDLRSGYHQLELDPASRQFTTFSTHLGLYRYKRLPFGLNSAAEIFQHTIQEVISGVSGARNVSDDIIVFGSDQADHDRALDETLKRLHQAGLTVHRQKCEFNKDEIEFFGFIFSAAGLRPDPKKVQALHDMPRPQNASEVRSFLGMVQYSSRFINNFATITEPLRSLTKQNTPWAWTETHETAFDTIKQALSATTTLAYFDPKKHTEIYVDASPVGVAGLLCQEGRTIAYASRVLTAVEQRYSQTEREALAVVWACKHFDIYVSGAPFTVITDHRPLLNIWQKPSPPTRIARWSLRLQPYLLTMKYKPGKENPADYMSRHPTHAVAASIHEKMAEAYISFLADTDTLSAVTLDEIKAETVQDATLQTVMKIISTGKWHALKELADPEANLEDLIRFRNVKDDLCVNAEHNVILKGTQLVIPASLRKRVVQVAHEGHQGITKTKSFIRSKVWFPGMDKAVELEVESCIPCQANTNRSQKEPMNMFDLPRGPWLELSLDFCGPLPSGDYILVLVDEYSRYPIAEIIRSTSADCVIPIVDKAFAMFGCPEVIKTDNGPPFQSHQWRSFMKRSGVKHRRVTPLWPQANAQAEAFNKPLEKAIRAAHAQHKNWRLELTSFIRTYRATPHPSTLFTPFRLLLGRDPKTKLPEPPIYAHPQNRATEELARKHDACAKQKMKLYADKRNHAKRAEIASGDFVLAKQRKRNKLTPPFNPTPMVVTATNGSMITAQSSQGQPVTLTRNSSYFKKLKHAPPDRHQSADDVDEPPLDVQESIVPQNTVPDTGVKEACGQATSSTQPCSLTQSQTQTACGPSASSTQPCSLTQPRTQTSPITSQTVSIAPSMTSYPRRSTRQKKSPTRFKDYVTDF
ncbi:hypothetical protein V1264_003664 [Littorina saxatilis]|uniref:Reverse transcriptase n=1 Tax=Littorina saxatilis TaxID=31220 RepID=A0AAN9B595_9CAEN